MNPDYVVCAADKPALTRAEIPYRLDILSMEIDRLGELTATLLDRLSPVSTAAGAVIQVDGATPAPEEPGTKVGGTLAQLAATVRSLNSRIAAQLDTLQL